MLSPADLPNDIDVLKALLLTSELLLQERDEKMYAPMAEACPSCGSGLRPLGEDVAEQLEFVPASFRVIRHMRPMLACSCCDIIVQAPEPSRPIERGIAGPGACAR